MVFSNRVFIITAIIFTLSIFTYHPIANAATVNSAESAIRLISSDRSGLELEVEVFDLKIKQLNGDDHTVSVTLDGEANTGAPGMPDLPHISRLIAVPQGAKVSVTWQSSEPQLVSGKRPEVITQDAESTPNHYALDKTAWIIGEFWPPSVVDVGEISIMRGINLTRLTINPVRVNMETGVLEIRNNLNIKLTFDYTGDISSQSSPRQILPTKNTLKLAESLVINPSDLPSRDAITDRGAYVYLIPDFNGITEELEPLINWRRRQGYHTEIITVARNASNVQVRNAIRDAYYEWDIPPEYVTLIGDADLQDADFMIPTFDVGRAYMWETDYKYALLDGDDLLPELAIARISCRSLAELRHVIGKILRYEITPPMDDPEWFIRAALMANDPRTGYSSMYLQRWARKLLMEVGFAEADTFYFVHDNQLSGFDFIRNNINQGISVFNYRGWGQFNGDWRVGDVRQLRNGDMLPLMILPTCNTGDYADHILSTHAYTEDFLWATNGGAIGAIGSSGYTHTNYNNVFDGGILNSFYRDQIWTIGWALNRGKVELYRHFGMFNDVETPQVPGLLIWQSTAYQFNLMGDGGTELWTGIPQLVDVIHDDVLSIGENRLQVQIRDQESELPLSDVLVTIVADDELIRAETTDANGTVYFTFEQREMRAETWQLTATRHDMMPYLADIEVSRRQNFLGASSVIIDDDRAGRSIGNGDGKPSPGERLELRVFIKNFGTQRIDAPITVILENLLGDMIIVEDSIRIQSAIAVGDSLPVTFLVDVGQDNWNGRRAAFHVNASSGDNHWQSSFDFEISCSDLQYAQHVFTPDQFNPGDTVWVDVTVRNLGDIPSNQMNARLVSGREVITVFNEFSEFSPVDIQGNDSIATARFRVYAHTLTVPGTHVNMHIYLSNEQGFHDTTHFSFLIGQPRSNTPFGPDTYGYVCFDDTDTDWDAAPVYDWVEIDPDLDGPGVDTEIQDLGNEQDFSVLVDLPFRFRYYGQNFRQISICSNGWFSFGDESKLADFQNRRIPPALGPRAQVCVLWTDLVNYTDDQDNRIGGVYYWYDEENARFIIQWSEMHRYLGLDRDGNMRPGGLNTFQAILYDPQVYPTYTGDGDIVFQYKVVNNDPDVDPLEYDTPYSTVGIVNLNGTDGMEYTYWNTYTPGAARLEDERAILWTTKLIVVVGYVQGEVIDLETGEPIPNAQIRGNKGSFAITRNDGSFFMDNVLIGEDYEFTAWAPGYNEAQLSGYDIFEGDTLQLFFELLHPTFTLSRQNVEAEVRPGFGAEEVIFLSNEGNGSLSFNSFFDYFADEENQLWDRLLHFNVTQITGDDRIWGVGVHNEEIWVTGSNNNNNPNYFYIFDNQGNKIRRLEQPSRTMYGFRGVTNDGELLYGAENEWIFGVSEDAVIVDSIPGPFSGQGKLQRALAYDYNDHFWVANGRDDPLVKIDRQGNIVHTYQHELDIQGLAYLPSDPEGYYVYIVSRDKTNPSLQVPLALVSKYNPETQHLKTVRVLEGEIEDRVGGIDITNKLDPHKWLMVVVMTNAAGDRVSVYDLGPNTTWVTYSPRQGELEPSQSQPIRMLLNTENLEVGEYHLSLRFEHNAANLRTDIPITLIVDPNAGMIDESIVPLEFALESAYPNPFNSATILPYSLPQDGLVNLTIYDLNGREVIRLVDDYRSAGQHRAKFAI